MGSLVPDASCKANALLPQGGAAFGPRPALVLPRETAEDLVLRTSTRLVSSERRRKAWHRFLIYTEDYAGLIIDKLNEQHQDAETRARLAAYVDLSINLALDITRDVAVVWKHQATRTIRDATDDQNAAFLELVAEACFAAVAPAWNRQAWLLGPLTVLPVVRRGRMRFDTLLPHFYDVIQDHSDPWGNPVAACWDVAHSNELDHLAYGSLAPEATSVVVDGTAYRYYSVRQAGKEVARVDHDTDKWIVEDAGDPTRHSVGEFPGSTLRFDTTHATSWWGCDRHQRLVDATIKIGCIDAKLGFVRKEQNKQQLVFKGDLSGMPAGQKHDPEIPIQADTPTPEQIGIDTLDLDTSPENFIMHATWVMQTVAQSYGADLASAASGGLGVRISFSHDSLTEIRNEQIAFARAFEKDLWTKTVAIAKANGHRLAKRLPDPQKVRAGFEVRYERLARSFESVAEEIEYKTWALSHGVLQHADLLAGDFPDRTPAERDEIIMKNIEAQGTMFDALARRDQKRGGEAEDPKLQTAAQINGAEGPKVRDGATPEPEEENEDE
jgi:hypothetical protein